MPNLKNSLAATKNESSSPASANNEPEIAELEVWEDNKLFEQTCLDLSKPFDADAIDRKMKNQFAKLDAMVEDVRKREEEKANEIRQRINKLREKIAEWDTEAKLIKKRADEFALTQAQKKCQYLQNERDALVNDHLALDVADERIALYSQVMDGDVTILSTTLEGTSFELSLFKYPSNPITLLRKPDGVIEVTSATWMSDELVEKLSPINKLNFMEIIELCSQFLSAQSIQST